VSALFARFFKRKYVTKREIVALDWAASFVTALWATCILVGVYVIKTAVLLRKDDIAGWERGYPKHHKLHSKAREKPSRKPLVLVSLVSCLAFLGLCWVGGIIGGIAAAPDSPEQVKARVIKWLHDQNLEPVEDDSDPVDKYTHSFTLRLENPEGGFVYIYMDKSPKPDGLAMRARPIPDPWDEQFVASLTMSQKQELFDRIEGEVAKNPNIVLFPVLRPLFIVLTNSIG
jgi:hypothetical protein